MNIIFKIRIYKIRKITNIFMTVKISSVYSIGYTIIYVTKIVQALLGLSIR